DTLYENYNYGGYFSNIDPYPFIDDDGTRYVYFVFRKAGDTNRRYLAGVRCGASFADVDYSSLSLLTLGGYMDVQGTTACSYQTNSYIDEGPVMTKHGGKYYLTYSYGSLTTSYQVAQAVSDSPLSGFRKLELSENGILLSGDGGQFDLANPGGHDIVEVNGKTYIVYHRNVSRGDISSNERRIAFDELRWVNIQDKNNQSLDVLYANGPTVTLQPVFEFAGEYRNIASQARVEVTNLQSGSSASALTDGLLSMYAFDSFDFNEKYVPETVITAESTITLTFDDYVTVRGLMVYNSKLLSRAFMEIERVEFDCKKSNGSKITNYIAGLSANWRMNRHSADSSSLKNAAAAIAEFDEIQCKEIRITINVPKRGWLTDEEGKITFAEEDYMMFEHEKIVGISEIMVLGK
ncbi:MAG: family 43 glycosylhydrolase, partial [Clostridiales bacterium]|nr:family 43 glycosylhydrolase [Clostridiales bacterium]